MAAVWTSSFVWLKNNRTNFRSKACWIRAFFPRVIAPYKNHNYMEQIVFFDLVLFTKNFIFIFIKKIGVNSLSHQRTSIFILLVFTKQVVLANYCTATPEHSFEVTLRGFSDVVRNFIEQMFHKRIKLNSQVCEAD